MFHWVQFVACLFLLHNFVLCKVKFFFILYHNVPSVSAQFNVFKIPSIFSLISLIAFCIFLLFCFLYNTGWLLLYPFSSCWYIAQSPILQQRNFDKWGWLTEYVICYNTICRSSNYTEMCYFPFCNPCCITPTKLSMMIGDFFLLFIKTVTSTIMVTRITTKKKPKIAHFTMLWGCGSVGTL